MATVIMTCCYMVFQVLREVAGRPSGGPTWPLGGLSIAGLVDSTVMEVASGLTTYVADVASLVEKNLRREKPRWLRRGVKES